jgi:hypothetical protein
VNAFLKRLEARDRTPLSVAWILATALYFLSLMLASLAIDRPRVVAWTHHGHLVVHYHPTAASQEAKIWLVALIPSAIVVGIGVGAVFIRRGVYLVCASMFIISAVLPHRLDTWVRHHTLRYPQGQDLHPDAWATNLLDRGEWEQSARETVLSLRNWMMGLAVLFAAGFALASNITVAVRSFRAGLPMSFNGTAESWRSTLGTQSWLCSACRSFSIKTIIRNFAKSVNSSGGRTKMVVAA